MQDDRHIFESAQTLVFIRRVSVFHGHILVLDDLNMLLTSHLTWLRPAVFLGSPGDFSYYSPCRNVVFSWWCNTLEMRLFKLVCNFYSLQWSPRYTKMLCHHSLIPICIYWAANKCWHAPCMVFLSLKLRGCGIPVDKTILKQGRTASLLLFSMSFLNITFKYLLLYKNKTCHDHCLVNSLYTFNQCIF